MRKGSTFWAPWLVLCLSSAALASPALDQLKQASLHEQRCLCQQLETQTLFTRVRETTTPVDSQSSAGELLARAEAAIQASVDDAKAGFTIAPLRFIEGYKGPLNPQLTFAAFDDGRTRLGAALNGVYSVAKNPSPKGLKISFCSYDEGAYRNTLDRAGPSLRRACAVVASLPDPAPGFSPGDEEPIERETWRIVRHLCGVDEAPQVETKSPPGSCKQTWTFEDAAIRVVRAIQNETIRLERIGVPAQKEMSQLTERLEPFTAELQTLAEHEAPGFVPRFTTIEDAIRQYAWRRSRYVLGVDGRVDFFPLKGGFNPSAEPDKNPLPRAQLASWQANLAGSWGRERVFLKMGLLLGQKQSEHMDSLNPLSPGLSFKATYVVGALVGQLTDDEENVQVEGQELPPHLLVGMEGSVAFVTKRTPTHPNLVDNANAALWLEFRFTEKLAVRTGFQLDAETVTRPEDTSSTPPRAELGKLQYSVPAFVLTALQF